MPENTEKRTHNSSIRDRSLSGIRWTFAQTIFVALLGPVSQIVKARFLVPEELGVVAVFMMVYGLLRTIENAGIGQSIVQKESLDRAERFTYLIIAAASGLLGALLLFAIAEPAARLFRTPEAAILLQLSGPLLFFALVDQYFRAILHRQLLFRGQTIVESGKRVLNLVFLSVFLGMGSGPISVAYAMLISTTIGAVALLFLTFIGGNLSFEYRWAPSATAHLISFGLPIAVKQIFTYVTHRADEFIIGLFLSPSTLGIYHLAKETLQRLQTVITSSFSRVLLSLFSRIRDDKQRLTLIYKRISIVVSYFGVSIFVGVTLTAESVVPAVFGAQWEAAVPAFQVLSIALIPIVLTANLASSLLYSVGHSKSVLVADIMINVPYLGLLLILGRSGLTPVLVLYTVYCFAKGIVLQGLSNRRLTITAASHLLIYGRVLARVAVMAAAVIGAGFLIPPVWSVESRAIAQVVVGVGSMIAVTLVTDRPILAEIKTIFLPSKASHAT